MSCTTYYESIGYCKSVLSQYIIVMLARPLTAIVALFSILAHFHVA
jgi:hypothetical protein